MRDFVPLTTEQIVASHLLPAEKLQELSAENLADIGIALDSCLVRQVEI